jgi:predicted aminopeptidase
MRWPALLCCALLGGCSTIGYYGQLAAGQKALMRAREPIARIVADPSRDPGLRQRLQKVADARRWAVAHLLLPDNRSYSSYVELDRPYVLWNVFATPELSVEPLQHCFPLVGCMAYRGYYSREAAERAARRLRDRGNDVYVAGVPAYSTLRWFEDPLLSSMMHWSDETLIATVFHELAHQKLFVPGDTAFNESFASFVGAEGLRQYLRVHGGDDAGFREEERRRSELTALVLASRQRLAQIYASDADDALKRQRKRTEFDRLRTEYRSLRDGRWQGDATYDAWIDRLDGNNAALLPFGLYDAGVPAFAALYAAVDNDWAAFYRAATALAESPAQRQALRSAR